MNLDYSLAEVLQQLQSGLYVLSNDLPNHGYYVTKNLSKKVVTFNLCPISSNLSDFYGTLELDKPQRFDLSLPVHNVKKFLINFLKYYIRSEEKPILAYDLGQNDLYVNDSNNHFYINRSAQVVMWKNGEIFKMKDNTCVIENFQSSSKIHLILREDDCVVLHSNDKQQLLHPNSLESLFLMDDDLYQILYQDNFSRNRLLIDRNVCEFKFLLEKNNRISVCMKTFNPYACWYFSNRCLFNILSKSIMEMLTFLKNNRRWGHKQILDDKIPHEVLNLKSTMFLYK